MADETDCPICYGDLGTPADLCPNGHKVCDTCRPQIQGVRTGRGATCPFCRAPIPYVPLPGPPPVRRARRHPGEDAAVVARAAQLAVDLAENPGENAEVTARRIYTPDEIVAILHDEIVAVLHDENPLPPRRGGGRPHIGPEWEAARTLFLANREAGRIPADSVFGGIHERKCGTRECERRGGAGGVRFLLNEAGRRRYRCELHQL